MNTLHLFLLLIIGIFFGIPITGVYADEDIKTEEVTFSTNNSILNMTLITGKSSFNQTGNITNLEDSTNNLSIIPENPVIFTGIEHPNEETDVKSSTPEGNPFIPTYAQGGVSVDFMGHLMEGRGNDGNVSSDISFHDHTSVNGYIRTLIKDFHYMGSIDTDS